MTEKRAFQQNDRPLAKGDSEVGDDMKPADRLTDDGGVYAIVNRFTGDQYIGQSARIRKRWTFHRGTLGRGVHHSKLLQAAWDSSGAAAFDFIILEQVEGIEALRSAERRLMEQFKPAYNVSPRASGPPAGYWKHTPETKAKLKAANVGAQLKGRKLSAETRERMRQAHLGVPRSPEFRAKIAASNRRRVVSPETREKMRVRSIANNAVLHLGTPEARAKARASLLARNAKKRTLLEVAHA